MLGDVFDLIVGLIYLGGARSKLAGKNGLWVFMVGLFAIGLGIAVSRSARVGYHEFVKPVPRHDLNFHIAVAFVVALVVSALVYSILFIRSARGKKIEPASSPRSSGVASRRPTRPAPRSKPSNPDHTFNSVGVCTRCGCGRSAAHLSCNASD